MSRKKRRGKREPGDAAPRVAAPRAAAPKLRRGAPGPTRETQASLTSPHAWVLHAILVAVVSGASVLFLIREHAIAGPYGFSLDDSWIHAVFARNVATGGGFSFNRGEPVAGSTAPLYTLLLALLYAVFRDPVWPAKIFGVVCHAAAACLAFDAARYVTRHRWLAFLAGLLVATSPPLLWAALSGMEISLYLLLVMLGLHAWVRGKIVAATLAWSAGIWARPDGFVLIAASMAVDRRRLLARVAVAAAVAVSFLAFNFAVGRTLLPQTVAAKGSAGFDLVHRTIPMLNDWLVLWHEPFRWLPGPAFALAAVIVVIVVGVATWRRQPLLTAYLVGCPLALSLFRDSAGQQLRYILYVIPFGVLAMAAALDAAADRIPRRVRLAAPAVLAAWVVAQVVLLPGKAEMHAWNVQNINSMQRFLGELAREKTLPTDPIATNDVGAIGYFSDRRIVDLMGLITPARSFPENLVIEHPRYLMIFLSWFQDYMRPDSLTHTVAIDEPGSAFKYAAIGGVELNRNTVCAERKMVVFERMERDRAMPREKWLYRQ